MHPRPCPNALPLTHTGHTEPRAQRPGSFIGRRAQLPRHSWMLAGWELEVVSEGLPSAPVLCPPAGILSHPVSLYAGGGGHWRVCRGLSAPFLGSGGPCGSKARVGAEKAPFPVAGHPWPCLGGVGVAPPSGALGIP